MSRPKETVLVQVCRLGANADSRDVVLPGKSLESTRAEEGIPGCHERAAVGGAKHDLCLQLACPNLTLSCPGCRRPRALDAGCSQSPQQVRLSGNVARIPGKLGHLPRCLPVACAWRPAAWDGVSGSHPVQKRPSPVSITVCGCSLSSLPAGHQSMMRGRDRDPHRSKLDSSPAVDVWFDPGSPAARHSGRLAVPPTNTSCWTAAVVLGVRGLHDTPTARSHN